MNKNNGIWNLVFGTLAAVFFIALVINSLFPRFPATPESNSKVITIEGYKHAFIVCNNHTVIEYGHENDPMIGILIIKAKEICDE